MPTITPIKTNFTAGEFSPLMFGREDISKYANGAALLENGWVAPYGGFERRPGTKFVAKGKLQDRKIRLIPFQFSTEQSYVIELGHRYMRFYTDNGQIISSGTPFEISTPYTENEIFDVSFAQKDDIMYLAHTLHEPRQLIRTSDTDWTLSEVAFLGGPFLEDNTTATTIASTGVSGTVTLTASVDLFNINQVGALWKIAGLVATVQGYVRITGFTSATSVTAEVVQNLSAGAATDVWAEGAWSVHRGFPGAVSFHEQRLVFAGSVFKPQTVWGSVSQTFEDFTPGTDDADPYTYTIAADQVNAIKWMVSKRDLELGTSGGTFSFGSGSDILPITPTNIVVRRGTTYGATRVKPEIIGSFTYYMQRNKRTLRQLFFSLDIDNQEALDMTLLSEHITKNSILQMTYQQDPFNILWAIRDDGEMPTLTRQIDQEVIGWCRQITDGLFESVVSIPTDEGKDQVWAVVNRTIGGVEKRYIEFFMPREFATKGDAFFVDSGLTYDGVPVTTISGLDHLEGKTVQIFADGGVVKPQVVSGGAITLEVAASKVHVGLQFITKIKLLPMGGGSPIGTGQTKLGRVNQIAIRIVDSLGGKFGYEDKLDPIIIKDSDQVMDSAPNFFTGDIVRPMPDRWDRRQEIFFQQDQPLPFNLLAVVPTLRKEDL